MAYVDIDIEKIIAVSREIIDASIGLREIHEECTSIDLKSVLGDQSSNDLQKSILRMFDAVANEAAKMDSFGDALQTIAELYRKTDQTVADSVSGGTGDKINLSSSESAGTDKRSWWKKLWDWITGKEPAQKEATTSEQERAADRAMKRGLWDVLQEEKYSQENWDKASVEERKQILQDYMREVIRIYGLQDVDEQISWDPNAKYTNNSIAWGYYTHDFHRVTLNEQALTDSVGSWDSYNLLATVSHELRHAYQHEAIDHPTRYMVSQETIDAWRNNFAPGNYIDSNVDYPGYRNQVVEVDARNFEVSRNQRRP